MKEHMLKCWTSSFKAVERGEKTFEFRRNDRDFQVGDVLILEEWDPGHGIGGGYAFRPAEHGRPTIPKLRVRVTYILHGGQFGVPVGYCVMSIVPEAKP